MHRFVTSGLYYFTEVPSICSNCHVNARCVYDEITRRHECVCSKGWTGDGTDCQMEDCRVTQNCDPNADCVNDVIVGKFRCLCKNGFMGKASKLSLIYKQTRREINS